MIQSHSIANHSLVYFQHSNDLCWPLIYFRSLFEDKPAISKKQIETIEALRFAVLEGLVDANAHVEGKNWTYVRKVLGYLRNGSKKERRVIEAFGVLIVYT